MNDYVRVPLRPRGASFLSPDDIAASIATDPPRCARRFSLDVAEDALAQMSGAMVEHVAKRLAETVVMRHEPMIRDAIRSYLTDRKWAEPILREAIRDTVREWVYGVMESTDFGEHQKGET